MTPEDSARAEQLAEALSEIDEGIEELDQVLADDGLSVVLKFASQDARAMLRQERAEVVALLAEIGVEDPAL